MKSHRTISAALVGCLSAILVSGLAVAMRAQSRCDSVTHIEAVGGNVLFCEQNGVLRRIVRLTGKWGRCWQRVFSIDLPSGVATERDMAAIENLGAANISLGFTEISRDGMERLSRVPGLRFLSLGYATIGDDEIEPLSRLQTLYELEANDTGITDASAAVLGRLKGLEVVWLDQTGIGDDTVIQLSRLPKLHSVGFVETKVTDRGLAALASCSSLRQLDVSFTNVTEAGVASFRKIRPDVDLQWAQPDLQEMR